MLQKRMLRWLSWFSWFSWICRWLNWQDGGRRKLIENIWRTFRFREFNRPDKIRQTILGKNYDWSKQSWRRYIKLQRNSYI
jgi:hypothetical protein